VHKAIAFGSPSHIFLQQYVASLGELKNDIPLPAFHGMPFTPVSLKTLLNKARNQLFHDRSVSYNCWEWNATGCVGRENIEFLNLARWRFINVAEQIKARHDAYWLLSERQIHTEAISILNDNIPLSLLHRIYKGRCPIFIATDGSHKCVPDNIRKCTNHLTTGAAVLCLVTMNEGESFEQQRWANRPAIPILARFSILPCKIGCSESDIGHGEGVGGCLGMEMVDPGLRRILIMDSASVRTTMQTLRDREEPTISNRQYIRKTISGISKNVCSRMERCFFLQKSHDDMSICSDN